MLADVPGRVILALVLGEQFCVAENDLGDLAQGWFGGDGLAAQGSAQLREEPRPAQATAADLHTIAARGLHHAAGVIGAENIAIAQHRNAGIRQVLFEPGDLIPPGIAGIALRGRAPVQGHGGGAGIHGDAPGIEVRVVLVVDAHAHLHRDGDIRALGGLDGGRDDIAKQAALIGQGRAAAAPGHLGDGATEIHVDVIGQVLIHDDLGGLIGVFRVHRINLQGTRIFIRGKGGHVHGFLVALHQGARGDHLADIQARYRPGAGQFLLPAQRAEGDVGYPRHGGEDDGGGEVIVSNAQIHALIVLVNGGI